MSSGQSLYRSILNEELAKRSEKNPRYSLRAMAKSLGLAPGALSQTLSGKRIPSYKTALKMLSRLGLSPDVEQKFLESLAKTHQLRGLERISPAFKKMIPQPKPKDLSIEMFRIIGDWQHYAILFLTLVDGFQSTPKWIASQLSITEIEAKLAIQRLLDCGMLKTENGNLVAWDDNFTTSDKHLTTGALRRHQKQILEKAITSLENDPIEFRSHSSMTMAIDPRKMKEAKQLIEDFTQKLSGLLESGQRTHVYELSLCLFPLQKLNLKNLKESL